MPQQGRNAKRGGRGRVKSAEDEISEFMFDVEASAKQILKSHNKKRAAEAARERVRLARNGTLAAAETSDSAHLSRAALNRTFDSSLIINAEMPPAAQVPSAEEPSLLQTSMSASDSLKRRISAIPFKLDPQNQSSTKQKMLPPLASTLLGSEHKSSNSQRSKQHSGSLPALHGTRRAASSAPSLHDKLRNSPFAKVSMMKSGSAASSATLRKTMNKLSSLGVNKSTQIELGLSRSEHDVERRMCNACWSDPTKISGNEKGLRTIAVASEQSLELQGPTNWASDDLRRKYRGEDDRETAWEAYLLTKEEAERREREEGVLMSVATIERHPMFTLSNQYVDQENTRARQRARARNKMKVFVLDVHRVWETNLEYVQPRQHVSSSLKGLQDRRDVASIEEGHSQVQSVSTSRALSGAVEQDHPLQSVPSHEDVAEEQDDDQISAHHINEEEEEEDEEEDGPPPILAGVVANVPVVVSGKEFLFSSDRLTREGAPPLLRFSLYDCFSGYTYRTVVSESEANSVLPAAGLSSLTGVCQVVHREGMRRGGLHIVVEVRVGGQDGVAVVRVDAYSRKGENKISSWQNLVYAPAHDVISALSIDSQRLLTRSWLRERARIHLWRALMKKVQVVDGVALLPLDLSHPDSVSNAVAYTRRLATCLTLKDEEEGNGTELCFQGTEGIEEGSGEEWEKEAAPRVLEPSLSVRVCGRMDFFNQVPGTTAVGKLGLGAMLSYKQAEERTQTAAMYVRDPALSSTNSVLVTVALALDTPVLVPLLIAWLCKSAVPIPAIEPWPPGKYVIPRLLVEPEELLTHPVESILDILVAATSVLQCDAEDPLDFLEDKLKAKIEGRKVSHRRLWEEHDKYFFRQWLKKNVFVPDPVVSPRVFGVTVRGAQPNAPATHGRHNWHSEQRCVETLCRRRVEKDFAYISHRKHHQGSNDANTYTCMMQHELVRELDASRLSEFLTEHRRRREAARIKAEQDALKAKIEAGKAALAAKRREQQRIESQLNAKQSTRKRRREGKGRGKGNSQQEWTLRVQKSVLVKEWGEWQERQDQESDTLFYHSTDEQLESPSQWDPPEGWPHEVSAVDQLASGDESEESELSDEEDDSGAMIESQEPGTDANHTTIDDIIESLSRNQEFLDKLSVRLGMIAKERLQDDEESSDSEEDLSSADESSDDDEEGGRSHQPGSGHLPGALQRHHGDRRRDHVKERYDATAQGSHVPPLALDRMKANKGKGWRRLKKAYTRGLVSKATSTHTQHAKGEMVNTVNAPSLVGMVDPVEGASYELPEQIIPVEVVLIKDIMADTERLMKEQARLMGTSIEDASSGNDAQRDAVETRMDWEQKAILLVKNGKLSELEEALDEDVPVDTADEHGNSLLHLAVQQGNKRITKFLMRRGAKINLQNLNGNTILHYCYEYNFEELAEYLKEKGADDSLLNADGLTCYEGLSRKDVDQI